MKPVFVLLLSALVTLEAAAQTPEQSSAVSTETYESADLDADGNGKTHRFEGGLAIFDWHFADGGRRIVFSQQTVHFTCSVHWELRDIASERLLATVDIPEACGQIPDPPKVEVPKSVTGTVSGVK